MDLNGFGFLHGWVYSHPQSENLPGLEGFGNPFHKQARWRVMEGTLTLFGFPSTVAELDVLPRTMTWRLSRASVFLGGGLILAPAVGVFPPHAPWFLGALGIGGFLGIRKWRERFTVLSLRGSCPKCGGSLSMRSGTPLRPVMTVSCPGCNHDSRLITELEREPDSAEGAP